MVKSFFLTISVGIVSLMGLATIFQSIFLFLVLFVVFVVVFVLGRYGISNALKKITEFPKITISKNSLKFRAKSISHFKLEGRISIQKITPRKITKLFKLFLEISVVKKIQGIMSSRISHAIAQSGQTNNSRILSIQGLAYSMVAFIIAIPVGIVTGITIHPVFYLVCLAVPLVVFSYNLLYLKSLAQSRKSSMHQELPIFVVCASILETVDIPLFESLLKITNSASSLFPTLKKEGAMLSRNIEFFTMTPIDALKNMARHHPNREFSRLIYEYTSTYLTGGTASTVTVMEANAKEFVRNLQFHIKSYTQSANEISQMILLAFIMLPLMALGMTFIASGDTATTFLIAIMLILPIISIMIMLMIDSKQPQSQDSISIDLLSIGIAVISFPIMMFIMSLESWQALGIGAIIFGISSTARQFRELRETAEMDAALPSFMREISDNHDKGVDIYLAITNIASSSEYNKTFQRIIGTISKKMQYGHTLTRASETAHLKSWMSKIIFFILSEIHESGGGNSKTLQMVTTFVEEYSISKKEMISSLKGSLVIAYVAPVLMVMILAISLQMTTGLTSDIEALHDLSIGGITPVSISDGFLNLSYLIIIESSILIALMMSKVAYFTVKHSLHVGILSGVSLVMVMSIPHLPNIIS